MDVFSAAMKKVQSRREKGRKEHIVERVICTIDKDEDRHTQCHMFKAAQAAIHPILKPAGENPRPIKTERIPAAENKQKTLSDLLLLKRYLKCEDEALLMRSSREFLTESLSDSCVDYAQRLKIAGYLLKTAQQSLLSISIHETTGTIQLGAADSSVPQRVRAVQRDYPCFRSVLALKSEHVETAYALLQAANRHLAVLTDFTKDQLYNFINEHLSDVQPCALLCPAVESVAMLVRMAPSCTFKMILSVYLKLQYAYLTKGFIHVFFDTSYGSLSGKQTAMLRLIKAKELFKLHRREEERGLPRNCLRILDKIKTWQSRSLKTSIYRHAGDFHTVMELQRGRIDEYAALWHLNRPLALERIGARLGTPNATHNTIKIDYSALLPQLCTALNISADASTYVLRLFLLYAELTEESGHCPVAICIAALQRCGGAPKICLALLRYLKRRDLETAYAYGRGLCERVVQMKGEGDPCTDLILYETCIAARKAGKDYMRLLNVFRKSRNIPLLVQEMHYFELRGTAALEGRCGTYTSLFLFKAVLRRDCNRSGCCSACRDEFSYVGQLVHKFKENGDFVLLHYLTHRDPSIRRQCEHLEPTEGFYWPRLGHLAGFQAKMDRGLAMAVYDCLQMLGEDIHTRSDLCDC